MPISGMETDRHWKSQYPVKAIFLPDQLETALDHAFNEHPELFHPLGRVDLVIMDRPNTIVGEIASQFHERKETAQKYLRVRNGDTLVEEKILSKGYLLYPVPTDTLRLVSEYFSNARIIHLVSLIWHAIGDRAWLHVNEEKSTLFFIPVEGNLIILEAQGDRLVFSKQYQTRHASDVAYFAWATYLLLQPEKAIWIRFEEFDVDIEIPEKLSDFIYARYSLPSIKTLLQRYKS